MSGGWFQEPRDREWVYLLEKEWGGAKEGRKLRAGKSEQSSRGAAPDLIGGSQGSREASLWDGAGEGGISRNLWAKWDRGPSLGSFKEAQRKGPLSGDRKERDQMGSHLLAGPPLAG